MATQRTLTIPANGVQNMHRAGKVFFCITATAAFQVRPDNGPLVDQQTGRGFGSATSVDPTQVLTFVNNTGTPIDVTFYWGFEDFKGDPAQFSGTVQTTTVNQNKGTFATGTGNATLNATSNTANFTGINGSSVRKQIVFTNKNKPVLDPSSTLPDVLEVRGSDGLVMAIVYPQQAVTFESGGTFSLRNPGAAAVDYCIGEVWYNP